MQWLLKEYHKDWLNFLQRCDDTEVVEATETNNDKGQNPKWIKFQDNVIRVPEVKLHEKITLEHCSGSSALLKNLRKLGIAQIKDLPYELNDILDRMPGVGESKMLTFLEQLKKGEKPVNSGTQSKDRSSVKTIRFKNQFIGLSEEATKMTITHEDFAGLNSVIHQLHKKEIHQIKDLPDDLTYIYKQMDDVGPGRISKFFSQLRTIENLDESDEEVVINQGEGTRLNGEIIYFTEQSRDYFLKEIEFTSSIESLLIMLDTKGYKKLKELPVDFRQLLNFQGVGHKKVTQFFRQLQTKIKKLDH
ncbi:hypothetical protein EPH95_05940 [Salicibibacter halophilus]|uniref:Uncharacterized protein n=1 Tax=Salicibibacter halophilus TaxID=2502791 RepID=A0A514LFZ7_9BACI|nr:hypothetical protein [Salicibibacter halophilus]QDI90777.1 hypothetical protein EPH95_05940 [Salicibibacter halophilus]